jgi:uncharacterized protein YegP (UPF0339 family)
MRKYLAAAVLSAGMLVASTATNPIIFAQGAKDKKTKVEPTSGGHIEIGKGKDGKYRFTVRDADEKYLGGSTVGHATEKECREAIETFKKVVAGAKVSMKDAKPAK